MGDLPGPITGLAVYDSGDVVSYANEYRRARLSADGLAAIARCADAVGFSSLDSHYTDQSHPSPDGMFCAVADASTTDVLAPTSAGPKTVSAYAIDLPGSMECPTFPAALMDTYRLLEQVADEAQRWGAPWIPDAVQVKRWPPYNAKSSELAGIWPAIPVPTEEVVTTVRGSDAAALLGAVQYPETPHTMPRHFRGAGMHAMRLPDGSTAKIIFLVVLPGDDGLT